MAGEELPPVVARLIADTAEFARQFRDAAKTVRDLNDPSLEAAAATQRLESRMRDSAVGAEAERRALAGVRDEAIEATAATDALTHAEKKAGDQAKRTGDSFLKGFASFVIPGKKTLWTTGIASALAALPALTAGVGALAGAGLAAAFLYKTGAIKPQVTSLMSSLKSVMTSAVQPMIGPLRQAISSVGKTAKQLEPVLHGVFAAIGPMVMPLTRGLEGLVKGVLPGFLALMKAARPAVKAVASLLSGLGHDLGSMFSAFAPAVRASAVVLGAIGKVLNSILPVAGKVAAALAGSLAPVLKSIGSAVKALAPAIAVIAKGLGAFAGAVLKSLSGALSAVAVLMKGLAPSFRVLAAAAKQVFTVMENKGVFGILEDSLESLAGPLAKLVNSLVSGLAPILPKILGLVMTLVNAGIKVLSGAVQAVIPPLVKLVNQVLKALLPILDPIISMVAKLAGTLATVLVQAVSAVLPGLVQLISAVLQLLPALAPLIPPLARLVTVIVKLAVSAIMPLMPLISLLASLLARLISSALVPVVAVIAKVLAAGLSWIANMNHVKGVVGDVIGFIKAHWKLLVSIIGGPLVAVALLVATHWKQIEGFFRSAWAHIKDWVRDGVDNVKRILAWFGSLPGKFRGWWDEVTHAVETAWNATGAYIRSIPGRILHSLGDMGKLLWDAGRQVVEGLINGVKSMFGQLGSIASSIGSHILGGIKDVLGIFSPSKRMAEIGLQITQGLSQGMSKSAAQVLATANTLGNDVVRAATEGAITSAQADQLGLQIAAQMQSALRLSLGQVLSGSMVKQLQGTTSGIHKALLAALKSVWQAASGGLITRPQASGLAAWLKTDNAQLETLARQRNHIASEIRAATQYAASVTSSAESTYSLANASQNASGGTRTVGGIIGTLQADVRKIRKFRQDLRKLAKEGLSRAYLSQLVAMGPDQGGPVAAELAAASLSQIGAVNTAEREIAKQSRMLGLSSANEMYDSGKQAGKGFLSGLKAQQKQIEAVMRTIAKSMVRELRKELGIASPSRVMQAHGLMAAEGLAQGLIAGERRVLQAAGQLAGAVTAGRGYPAGVLSASRAMSQPLLLQADLHVEGRVNDKVLFDFLQRETFRYNVRNSGKVTGGLKPGTA